MKKIILLLSTTIFTAFILLLIFSKIGLLSQTKVENSARLHNISLLTNQASPDAVTVNVGDYVQFNSKDGQSHDIALGSGNAYGFSHDHELGLESGKFGPDEAYKIQFKQVGIYNFHDHLDPKIYIAVVVTQNK